MIRLSVPGMLAYRDLALRVVAASCKLCRCADPVQDTSHDALAEDDEFDLQVISAFGEAFNNIAIHSYENGSGDVHVEIETAADAISIRVYDRGESYDPTLAEPPADLPESGMGLYIIRSFMDVVSYRSGNRMDEPNELYLYKKRRSALGR